MLFVFVIDRLIRHRACALKDTVHAIIRDELDEDFEKICAEIRESRSKRGFSDTVLILVLSHIWIGSITYIHNIFIFRLRFITIHSCLLPRATKGVCYSRAKDE